MQMSQTDTINDIVGQAHRGSVAAIIQVLNEKLADASVRTRAILAGSTLQLLCEAPTAEQLPQREIVTKIQGILEKLAPRHIHKVHINGRIIREQQLLWLEEITRDPEKQLLWSELIILKRPNVFRQFWRDIRQPRPAVKKVMAETKRERLNKQYFLRGVIGGASLCLLVVLVGWAMRYRLGIAEPLPSSDSSTTVESNAPEPNSAPVQDAFAQAVRLAEQTAVEGQTALTSAEWLDLATRWRRASELMEKVPPEDNRYATAQNRVTIYRNNHEQALLQSERLRQQEEALPEPGSE